MRKANIILTGFMGSGKTAVGKAIAAETSRTPFPLAFLDTDGEIVKSAGMTIPHIFEHYGEYYFRELEGAAARAAAARAGFVIATGGGLPLNVRNMGYLSATGLVFYLRSTPDQLFKNTEHSTDRPLLNVENRRERIAELLAAREPVYTERCDIAIAADGRGITDIAAEILRRFHEYNAGREDFR